MTGGVSDRSRRQPASLLDAWAGTKNVRYADYRLSALGGWTIARKDRTYMRGWDFPERKLLLSEVITPAGTIVIGIHLPPGCKGMPPLNACQTRIRSSATGSIVEHHTAETFMLREFEPETPGTNSRFVHNNGPPAIARLSRAIEHPLHLADDDLQQL